MWDRPWQLSIASGRSCSGRALRASAPRERAFGALQCPGCCNPLGLGLASPAPSQSPREGWKAAHHCSGEQCLPGDWWETSLGVSRFPGPPAQRAVDWEAHPVSCLQGPLSLPCRRRPARWGSPTSPRACRCAVPFSEGHLSDCPNDFSLTRLSLQSCPGPLRLLYLG